MPFNEKQQDLEPRQIQSESKTVGPQLMDDGRSKFCATCYDSGKHDNVNEELAQASDWKLPIDKVRAKSPQSRPQAAQAPPLCLIE